MRKIDLIIERIDEVKKDYGNMSVKELESKYRVSYSTIQRALSKYGLISGKPNMVKYEFLYSNIRDFINDWADGDLAKSDMENKYKCPYSTMCSLARKLDLKRKTPSRRIDQDNLVKDWKSGLYTYRELSEIYKISESTILRIVKNKNDSLYNKRTYPFNERYFQSINTEHKAYWLGFIYADGSISSKKYELSFNLQEEDGYLLQEFYKDVGSEKEIKYYYNDEYKRFYVHATLNHPLLKQDLIEKGAVPNKTYKLKFPSPDIIPNHLMNHFIRGYFDGDGSINVPTEKYKTSVSFVGTKDFIFGLKDFLLKYLNIDCSSYKVKNSSVYCISKSGRRQVQKILNWMYNDSTIFLKRKYEKANIALLYCKEKSMEEMKKLIKKLNKASDLYYIGKPIMSDKEFDEKLILLEELEKETGITYANSPTINVGYSSISELKKVKLDHYMKSLRKTHTLEDLNKFKNNRKCFLSIKCDGLSLTLRYKNGVLLSASTRGNGVEGTDVYHHIKSFKNVPLKISYMDELVIDGEAIIYNDDFKKINKNMRRQGKEEFKNSRNLAAGTLSLLDNRISVDRSLSFIGWRVIVGFDGDSNIHKLIEANKLGFTIVPYIEIDSEVTNDDLLKIKDIALSDGIPMDGCVLSFDCISYGESLGSTSKFPKHSLAFKFGEEEADTILRDIEWSMGKTGELTPVAIFDPVELAGTEVSRASLHNISIMGDLYRGTWYEGLKLTVIKANEIIPQIISVEDGDRIDGKHCYIPAFCPVCGSPTEIHQDNNSKVLVCINANCSGKKLGKFVQYCSKDAMDIKGLSEATLKLMLNRGIISEYRDLYFLNMAKNRLSQLPGMGARSVNNLIKAIEKSSHTTLDRFLVALSIPNIGRSAAKAIVKHCDSVDDFFEKWKSIYRWSNIPDFGEVMEKSLNIFGVNNREMIEDLIGVVDIEEFKTETSAGNSLEGLTFVITGSVNHFKNRNELKARIEQLGGKVAGSVSKKTSYLINNDKESSSSKNKKAKDLGIPIISEEDFLALINNAN